jgi:hypothetical protein
VPAPAASVRSFDLARTACAWAELRALHVHHADGADGAGGAGGAGGAPSVAGARTGAGAFSNPCYAPRPLYHGPLRASAHERDLRLWAAHTRRWAPLPELLRQQRSSVLLSLSRV